MLAPAPRPLKDLIHQLEQAAGDAARRLRHARDRSIARTSGTLALRAEALLLAHVLDRPWAEIQSDVRKLAMAFVQLEFVATRSRLPIADRAAITMGRALAAQVNMALAQQAKASTAFPSLA
jgi:hypothetical protein